MAYRFAQLSLGLVSLLGPAVLAAPMPEVVTQVVTVPAPGYTQPSAAPASNNQSPPPASGNKKSSSSSNNDQSGAPAPGGSASGLKSPKGVSFDKATTIMSGAGWAYDWNPKSMGNLNGAPFVPMLKDKSQTGEWNGISPESDACLAFNEPDVPLGQGGSQMEPGEAASLYQSTFMKGCSAKSLGAPAVSSKGMGDQDGLSLKWLEQFAADCKDCKIDFWPLHFYATNGLPDQFDYFTKYVTAARNAIQGFAKNNPKFGTDMWFTEIGQYGGGSEEFTSQCIDYMNKQPDIKAYSPTLGGNPDDASSQPTDGSMVAQIYGS